MRNTQAPHEHADEPPVDTGRRTTSEVAAVARRALQEIRSRGIRCERCTNLAAVVNFRGGEVHRVCRDCANGGRTRTSFPSAGLERKRQLIKEWKRQSL